MCFTLVDCAFTLMVSTSAVYLLVRDEQTHPHRPLLVVSHSTCPPLSSSPHANSFVIGPAVIKHTHICTGYCTAGSSCLVRPLRPSPPVQRTPKVQVAGVPPAIVDGPLGHNVEGAVSSTIPNFQRHNCNESRWCLLLPSSQMQSEEQVDSPVLGERTRTNRLFVEWPSG